MGVRINAPVRRQGFSFASAAKILRKAVVKMIFLQCTVLIPLKSVFIHSTMDISVHPYILTVNFYFIFTNFDF